MIYHQRRVLVVGPNELRAVAFSPSRLWKERISRILATLGTQAHAYEGVILAPEPLLNEWRRDEPTLLPCSACATLQACSAYETMCEPISETMSLLTVIENARAWAWVGQPSVVEMSGVLKNPETKERLHKLITGQVTDGEDSVVGAVKNILEKEKSNVKEFLAHATGRIIRESSKTAEAAVNQTIDELFRGGGKRFREAFQNAPSTAIEAENTLAEAAQLLGVTTGADIQVIYAAHREMMKKYHPDSKSPHASPDMARKLNVARDTLLKARKRA